LKNPNPNCQLECRFIYGPSFTTALHYERVYDKNGNLISQDPNTTTGTVNCIICSKRWNYTSMAGAVKYKETK